MTFVLHTLPADMFGGTELAVDHLNHQNFKKSLLPYKCGLIFGGMKGKFFFFEKMKFKMANSKKGHFSKSPILDIFL